MAWHGMAWHGMAWHGMVNFASGRPPLSIKVHAHSTGSSRSFICVTTGGTMCA